MGPKFIFTTPPLIKMNFGPIHYFIFQILKAFPYIFNMEFSLLGIEWDKKPFRNRADKAPKVLREFFEHVETFDKDSRINLEDHLIRDLGDIKPTSYDDMIQKVK